MRREHIERLLPASFQRAASAGGVLSALLLVMQRLHEPSEALLAHVDDVAAAYRAPEALLPFLSTWVAWDHLVAGPTASPPGIAASSAIPPGRMRDLVANGASLAATRGTAQGLCRLLSIVCGVNGFRVDEPADRAFHLVVRVPMAAAPQLPLIRRVVAAEKPAATTCEVVLDEPQALTTDPSDDHQTDAGPSDGHPTITGPADDQPTAANPAGRSAQESPQNSE